MKLVLGDKSLWIIIIIWVFILGFVSNTVISAEYYTGRIYEYDEGGQIVNVTMLNGEYVYIYYTNIPEDSYGTDISKEKIIIGDILVKYKVKDGIELPILYPARQWTETLLNNEIVETTEGHSPINILIGLYVTQLVIGIINYARKSIKPKTD